jgi:adenine-specific DNA-methyltransferase
MIELNRIYNKDCIDGMSGIDNETIDLAILDPPYFRILNEKWDKFKDKSNYFSWTKDYLFILEQKIRLNGTVLLFGCSRNFNTVSGINNILEELDFEFIQEIILDKGMKSVAGRTSKKIKMLPPVSENIIVYRKNGKPFIKSLLKHKQKEFNFSSKQIREIMGFAGNGGGNWTKYCGDTEFPLFPTEEHWNKIKKIFDISIEYKSIKETYNPIFGLTNVWTDIEFYVKDRIHPSQKPISLMERCLNIFSDEKNIVLDLFSGSGSTCIASKNTNRNYIGFEKDFENYNKSIENAQNYS